LHCILWGGADLSSKDLQVNSHHVPCIYLSSLERHPHGSRISIYLPIIYLSIPEKPLSLSIYLSICLSIYLSISIYPEKPQGEASFGQAPKRQQAVTWRPAAQTFWTGALASRAC